MTIHMIKLSVGPDSLDELIKWQASRLRAMKRGKQAPVLMHITRQMPRRAEEIVSGGSIYWVIKGFIVARQKIAELRPIIHGGIPHCAIILDSPMIQVQMRPRRPFQGWRYLKPKMSHPI